MLVSNEIIKAIKAEYKFGDKVELVCMKDKQAPPKGTKGIVQYVDDIGTIHVAWKTGSTLGVAFGEDACKKVED